MSNLEIDPLVGAVRGLVPHEAGAVDELKTFLATHPSCIDRGTEVFTDNSPMRIVGSRDLLYCDGAEEADAIVLQELAPEGLTVEIGGIAVKNGNHSGSSILIATLDQESERTVREERLLLLDVLGYNPRHRDLVRTTSRWKPGIPLAAGTYNKADESALTRMAKKILATNSSVSLTPCLNQ